MAKHYEALQRAEEERRRRASGDAAAPVEPVEWDTSPQTAPRPRKSLLQRLIPDRPEKRTEPDTANAINKRRITILQPDSYVAEQFRTLRGRIDSMATQRPIKTVSVTSANPDDGKSTSSINLAVVTSMSVGRKVLLMDCDLRKPKIHRSLGLEPEAGLAEVLLGQAKLDDAIMTVEGLTLDVLPVRTCPPNPSELLASPEMRALIEEVSRRYDQVILDTPACLGLPDSKIVTELCDGVIMVVRAGATPRDDIQTALEIIDRRRILGLLLNGAEATRKQYAYY